MNTAKPVEQQPAAAGEVAEPPGADDQRGDGEEIGEHDPLDLPGTRRRTPGRGSAGPTLAMLVPSDDSSMESDRLASAQPHRSVALL